MALNFRGASGTADVVEITAYSDAQITGVFTMGAWARRETNGTSSQGRIFDQANLGEMRAEADSTLRFQSKIWTTTQGIWSIPDPGSNVWIHSIMSYDNGSTTNDPVWLVNGVSQTVTEVTTPAGTATLAPGLIRIGNDTTGGANRSWDGDICEVALWPRILTAAEMRSVYYFGVQAVPDYVLFMPLYTTETPSPNFYRNGNNGAITGSPVQSAGHAPIFPRFGSVSDYTPYVVAAAGGNAAVKLYHQRHRNLAA